MAEGPQAGGQSRAYAEGNWLALGRTSIGLIVGRATQEANRKVDLIKMQKGGKGLPQRAHVGLAKRKYSPAATAHSSAYVD